MVIVFHSNQLSLRGTEIALFDYACGNESILGNKSIILYSALNEGSDREVIKKFRHKFQVVAYNKKEHIDQIIKEVRADLMYAIKSGYADGVISKTIPNAIHAVFPTRSYQFHGEKYAYVSTWLSRTFSNNKIPSLPHIVNKPLQLLDSLREELKIPAEAIVFGSMGGAESFDIGFAKKAVEEAANSKKNIYFLFLNINKFVNHERVIFLKGSADQTFKELFINSCDAMLHARAVGETFGLACAEFSIRNKPVLTFDGSPQRAHLEILGESAIRYNNGEELYNLILDFDRVSVLENNWDKYSLAFNSKTVMNEFKKIFLDPNSINRSLKCTLFDKLVIAPRIINYKRRMGSLENLRLL